LTDLQVSLEAGQGLERRMRIQVPAGRIDNEVESRLRSAGRTASMKGFRPGKVPVHVIRQRFGPQIRQEVLQEVVQASYAEAIARENLRPAGGPRIEAEPVDGSRDLTFTAIFEVYPEFAVQGIDRLNVERPEVTIGDADLDQMIERLRRQRGSWHNVEREAVRGDRVIIDFNGRLGGEPFEGGQAEKVGVVIGEGRMLPDFEAGLIGIGPGGEKRFTMQFPADYYDQKLRGQHVEFEVKVHEVGEQQLAPLDADFLKSYGIHSGDIAEFRSRVRESLEREVAGRIQGEVRRQIMEQLIAANPVDLPSVLVSREAGNLQAEGMRNLGIKDANEAPPLAAYTEIAERRVRLGLVIGAVIREQGIKVDAERVRQKLDEICRPYDRPDEARKIYLQNPELMAQVENVVIEDQVLGWLAERAQMHPKPVTVAGLLGA
jgi:trigger factor